MRLNRITAVAAAGLTLGAAGCGAPIESFNTVTPRGDAVSSYFLLVLWPSALVFLLVIGALAYFVVRYRDRGRPGDPEPRQIHGHTRIEIAWTIAPVVLLTVLFFLAARTMWTVEAAAPPDALEIRVFGRQWWWEYQYPSLGIVTANEVHVPVGRPVRFVVTGADVIHSFWLPQLGWKKDAIPGKTNDLNAEFLEAGLYDGWCTEFCGTQHAWMRVRLFADPPEQFEACQQQQPAVTGQGVARGQQVFLQTTCVNCHAIAGTAANARVGPDLTHFGSRTTIGAGVVENTPDNLRRWLREVQSIKPGALMPNYTALPDEEIGALADYLLGLR
jgi:cytochrome c oxidase subunit 2